jgi:hypothetical protein
MMRFAAVMLCAVMLGAAQETPKPPRYAVAEPMPLDRVDDAYAIYSVVLTSGPIEWREIKRSQWMVEDITSATPLATLCDDEKGHGIFMSPHIAVHAPIERRAEWTEVLDDYDRRCHDVLKLEADKFKVNLPVHLLDEAARGRYGVQQGMGRPEANEFANGAGLHSFSAVFFNEHHTLAAVQQGMWCGNTCGNWIWVVLEKRGGEWHQMTWKHAIVMS